MMRLRFALSLPRKATALAVSLALLLAVRADVTAAQQLAQVQYRLVGVGLQVSPAALTVPRGVATQLNTTLTGAQSLPAGAAVRATLRGPSFPDSIEITATPGEPIFLPQLTTAGLHFLENIRLDIDANTHIPATPRVVNINVLDQLLVGAVTSRPLSLAEIQQRGIQFDENSFQAFMFTIALTTASGVKNLELPVLVPTGNPEARVQAGTEIPNLSLTELPGLELPNFGIEALMLEPIEEAPPGVTIPPIPGILVIPGNIAFLNQFFSVFLSVSNRAPDGTPLVVRNVRAEIKLPGGADGVMGNLQRDPPFAPGESEFDNPLRVARTAAGRQILKPILAAGPDGEAGTADDVDVLVPQGSGTTEFLVEGIKEGGHVIDIEIRGTLEGLPSGPIEVAGHVRGAVVVRDPNFALTFIHPDVVRAGTQYDLIVQIRNTSLVDANLVTVSLDSRNLTGARLANPSQSSQTIPTIRAGDSASVTLRLEALRTGRVTASTLELAGETGVVTGRRLSLRTGVSEQGVPLSSETLILPPEVGKLRARAGNDELTSRAVALLGEAHSIATAPRASLPLGVLPIPATAVVQRAGELTTAARRLNLSYRAGAEGEAEALPEGLLLTLQDLYFDFLGARVSDDGWDSLYRSSRQARLFGQALADIATRESLTLGLGDLIALQRHWADTESYRNDHVTVMTSAGGEVPVVLEIIDRGGRRLGGSLDPEGGRREIGRADVLTFETAGTTTGQLAALTRTDGSPYTLTLTAERTGVFDFAIVVTGVTGQLRHVVFRGTAVAAGERLTLTIRPRSDPSVQFERAGAPVPSTSEEVIVDGPPQVLGIVQMATESVDQFGRVIGVLFDKDVDRESAESAASYVPGAATIPMIHPPALVDRNAANAAFVQFGGRIVLVGLRDPVGPFVPRTIDVSGVRDLKNQVMSSLPGARILPDPDIGNGGQLTGRVLRADGTPVAGAEITYLQPMENRLGQVTMHVVTIKSADDEGRYGLDFVLQNRVGAFMIRARDVASGEQGTITAQVRTNGERLALDIVLVGRGTVEGVVRRQDGTPLANAGVRVVSATDFNSIAGATDQNGRYRITSVPVGPIALDVSASIGTARASGVITGSGRTTQIDVTVFGSATGVLTGVVRQPDGSNAAGIQVTIASEVTVAGTPLPSLTFLDVETTDAAGAFRFDDVPAGGFLVRAIDRTQGFIGDARVIVTGANGPDSPASVVVFLAGTGSVSGQVLERVGTTTVPVPGALVAGGTQIVTANATGHYTIPAVPVGARQIEAANPLTGARGTREVTILTAGQASVGIDIVLEPLARISGRVISPEGQPVGGQEVRVIVSEFPSLLTGGRTFLVRKTQTAADGTYAFDNLEAREYPLAAIRGNEVANGRARLSRLVTHDVVDLRLIRPTGRVSGRVVDSSDLAVAARVDLKARVPNAAGILELTNAGSMTSDPDNGFTFTGLFPGPFTATASSFFSPDSAVASGTLPEGNPIVGNIVLVLSKNTGSLSGCVLAPDGTTIAPVLDGSGPPLPLSVFITSSKLRRELEQDPLNTEPDGIRVDASDGCFVSSIPLPPDFYTIEVTDTRTGSPTFGLTGQAFASVDRGAETMQNVRLLGLGSLLVEVVDAGGQAIPGVDVLVRRTSYPNDTREAQLLAPTSTSPLVVQDLTEGPVAVAATVSSNPAVDVGGREELRGFGGHAEGSVIRGEQRIIRVVIDSAGIVSGRFLRVDGVTPVNGAEVQLMSTGRPTAFALTDASGAFHFDGVAIGGFHLDGFDPGTGRRARVDGFLQQDRQHVIQELRLGPLGTVRGVVLDSTRAEPRGGAEVQLTIPNDGAGPRHATAALDGTFTFESVPGGSVTVSAVSLDGLSGSTVATVNGEGELVQIEVVLEGSGRVEGIVRDANGAPVAGASVSLVESFGSRRIVQAGTSGAGLGRFAFDIVPVGPFTVEARPAGAITPGDGGRVTGEIASNGQVAVADITFQGIVTVGAVVTGAVGPAPVEVSLQSGGLFGGRATPTGQQGGVVLFEGIPRAPMTLSARQLTPTGTTISASVTLGQGDLPPPGGRVVPDVQLVLNQVATVQGIVTSPDGVPVSGARVTLTTNTTTTLALTQTDGRFEFLGVPLAATLRLDADGLSGGRAVFIGSVDEDGNVHDRNGDTITSVPLSLDLTPPRVTAVQPAAGAVAVPTGSTVIVTFSEPVDPGTVTTCTVSGTTATPTLRLLVSSGLPPVPNDPANLCDDSNVVLANVAVAADGRGVTLTPVIPLAGLTQYTVNVSRGIVDNDGLLAGGVRDLVGQHLDADFTWQFVTRDDVPPTVLTVSPATGASNVAEDSVVRITFSEPIAAVSINPVTFAVVGPGGPVTGTRELILGNTVAVFTPTDGVGNRAQLQSNASYTFTVAGVLDLANNQQRPQDVASATFSTRDTIAPTIATLLAPPGARSEQLVTVTATTTNTDVASIQFFVDGVLSATTSQPVSPGEYRASLMMPARNIQIGARALDTSGNVGPLSAAAAVALLPDNPPTVAITSPSPGETFAAGATVRFVVDATDDLGVVEIRGAASGAATTSATRLVSPASPSVSVFFDVVIPVAAQSGPLTFAAAAIDGKGQTSATATIVLNVTSAADAAILSSVNPSSAQQGQTRDVTITGQGTNFSQGTSSASFGAGVTVNGLTVTSVTSAIANVTIAPDAAVGARTVTVTTGTQVASLANGFTIATGTAVVTTLSPAAASQGQTLSVNLTSQFTHFAQGVTTADFGPGITVDLLTVNSPVSAIATITVSPTAAAGARNVTMTTGTEVATIAAAFTVQPGAAAIAQIVPATGEQGQTLTVTVTGSSTHFQQGSTIASFGAGIGIGTVTVTSPTSATVALTIAAFAAPGARSVTLTTGGEVASIANGFNVVAATAVLSAVDPSSGQQGQTLGVTVTGQFTHFAQGTTAADFGAGITVNSVTVMSPTIALVNVTIGATTTVGGRTVVMTTGAEVAQSAVGALTVQAGPARISALTPNNGRQAETLTVTINGTDTHFTQGTTTASFGPDIAVTLLTINSPVQATASIAIGAGASLNARTVTVTTGGEVASIENGFLVQPGQPVVFSVNPSVGRQAETLDIAVTGRFTNFVAGTTTASFGAGVTVNEVIVQSSTNATVRIAIDAAASPGSRTVVMTTGTETATLVGGFTVQAGAASLISANPSAGMQGQNLTVVLTGQFTHFDQGSTTASFGSGITVGTVTVNGPTLVSVPITILPAATTGPRSVTLTTGSEQAVLVNGFTVLPGEAAITLIQPNTARTDQTATVDVVAVFTNFQPGQTVAIFGPGISVGGAAEGQPGPVTVTSAASFTATLNVGASAALGPRDVVVQTGSQVLTVAGGFTVTTVDTTLPGVLTVSPAHGATGVPLNTEVVVEFNEPIDRTSITTGDGGNVALVDGVTGLVVPAAVTVDASGRIVKLVPTQLLAVERGYGIFLSAGVGGVLDTSGNRLPFTVFFFATGSSTDTMGPAVLDVSPSNGAVGVPLNALVIVRFTRPINPVTRPAGLVVSAGGQPVPGTYAFSDVNRTVTFTAANPLSAATPHTVSWNDQIRDTAGNSVTNPGSASFTTGAAADTTAPGIAGLYPTNGETGVPRNVVVRVAFSEPVNALSVSTSTFRVTHVATGQVQAGTVAVAPDGRSATWTPNAALLPETTYFAVIAFADLAGNGNSTGMHFTTAPTADTAGPAVTSIAPVAGAIDVPVNARVTIRLSEPVEGTSVGANAITLSPAADGVVALSGDRRTLTFTPTALLATATSYAVTVTGLQDGAGNLQLPFSASFVTSASNEADTVSPTVTGFVPVNGTVGVPVTSAITTTFSEPIDRGAVTSDSIPVYVSVSSAGFVQVPGHYDVNAEGTVVTFTPLSAYPGNASVFINVNSDATLRDTAGNIATFAQGQFTTAADADVTAPVVTSVTPVDGTAGVGLNATVVLTFSEPLNPTTVHGQTFALFAESTWLGTSVTRSADNRTVMLTTFLPPLSPITVVVTSGVRDLSGNALADFTSQFTTGPAVDASAPAIVSQRPGQGATAVTATATVTLYANEALKASTVGGALRVSENGVLVTGALLVTGGGTAVRFTPDQPFAPGAHVQVFVDGTAQDTSGNALTPYQGQFTIAADDAATAPTLVQVSPAQTSGVLRNAVFDFAFSESLNAETVTTASVQFQESSGGATVPAAVSLRGNGRVIRVVPLAPLAANTGYVIVLTSDVRDLQGAPFAGPAFWGFGTGAATDVQAPSIDAVTPPSGVVQVGINAPIRVRFSEAVNPLTVNDTTLQVSSAAGVVSGTYSFDSTNREVTLTPMSALPDATAMTIVVSGVEDLAGNPVNALLSPFTTRTGADTVAPTVAEFSVFHGEADVAVNSVFTIEFSEPVDPLTVTPATVGVADDAALLPTTISLSADGRTVTVAPNAPLAVGRSHVLFADRAIRDLAGNAMPFFAQVFFAAAFQPDTTPPQVVLTSPVDGETGVSRAVHVQVLFDEPVQPMSLDQIQLSTGGVAVVARTSLTNANRTVVIEPSGLLAGNTTYTISVAGVRDTSGRPQSAPVIRTFTTAAGADLIFPTVVAMNPSFGETGVPRNVVVRVVFSEPANPLSVNGTTFRVVQNLNGRVHSGSIALAADRRSATWTPNVPLLPDTMYRFGVGFTDGAGNGSGVSVDFTTGTAIDTTGPEVTAVSPESEAANVAVNARVVARLSEPLDPTSVRAGTVTLSPAVAGTVALTADRRTLTFIPATPLAAATRYAVAIDGLRDVAGNAQLPFNTAFTTSGTAELDVVSPTVTAFAPPSGTAGVPVTSGITVTLSEPIDRTAVTSDSIPVYVFIPTFGFVQVPGSYTVNADATVATFTPLAPYPASTSVFINVNSDGTLRDVAGNALVFAQGQFTTAASADAVAPVVTSVTPVDGSLDVGLNTTVVVTFSEALDPTTVDVARFALFAGPTWLPTGVARSADNRTVILTSALPPLTPITVVVTSGVRDLSGNALADFTSQFTTGPLADASAPAVVTQRPGNGAVQVSASTTITLFLNEPLNASTVDGSLRVSENGFLKTGAVVVTGGGTAVRFTPDVPFATGARIQVFLDGTALDLSGNAVTPYQGQLTIAADDAATAPTLVQVSPAHTSGVVLNAVFDFAFSEPLNAETVTAASVQFQESGGGAAVPAAVSLRSNGRVIRVVPLAPLAANAAYVIVLTSDVRDLQDTPFAGPAFWIFGTGAATDVQTPSIVAVTPPSGAVQVGINAPILVRFSEPVNPLTVDATTVQVGSAAGVVPGTFTFNSTNTEVTLTPVVALPDATVMTVVVLGVEDLAGNAVAPQVSPFTTRTGADTVSPRVTAFSIPHGETNVPVNAVFTVEFSEPVDPQTITLSTIGLADNVQLVPATLAVSADGRTVSVAPNAPLAAGQFYVLFADRSIRDLAGNPVGFFSQIFFTTALDGDTAPPQVVVTNPVDGQTSVPRNVQIQVLFDEPIDLTSLGGLSLQTGSTTIPVVPTLTNANRTVTLAPATVLSPDTSYVLSISGVRDRAGNSMPVPALVAFATGTAADLRAPSVTTIVPGDGAVGVAVTVVLALTFNEPVNPVSLASGGIVLRNAGTTSVVPTTVTLTPDLRTAMVAPAAALDPGTQYQVVVNGATDSIGYPVSPVTSAFSTSAGEAPPP